MTAELTPEQRRARVRAYVDACDQYGYTAGCCSACGEPWDIHSILCDEYPDDEEEEPLAAFMTGVLGLALVAQLVAPGTRTGDVIQAVRDSLLSAASLRPDTGGAASNDRGGSMDNQQQRDAAEEEEKRRLATDMDPDIDDQDDGSDIFKALDRHDDQVAGAARATQVLHIVQKNMAGEPVRIDTMSVHGYTPIAISVARPPLQAVTIEINSVSYHGDHIGHCAGCGALHVCGGHSTTSLADALADWNAAVGESADGHATMPSASPAGGVQGREVSGVVPAPMDGPATGQFTD